MSNPSPKKKNGAISTNPSTNFTTTTSTSNTTSNSTAPPQPRQIRFVSSDGQPQTKRRRVTAACRTCRKRKIRCSGEQPVCKTCSDYGHTCLGYNDPEKSEKPSSQTTTKDDQTAPLDVDDDEPPLSRSPTTPRASATTMAPPDATKSPKVIRPAAVLPLTKDTLTKATKDQDKMGFVDSPESSRTSLSSVNRTHVPYFRYFGPTAIVPGFKQMVVRVRDGRRGNLSHSSGSVPSVQSPQLNPPGVSLAAALADGESNSIPFYDPDDSLSTSNLVTHLCELFFVHLGCSFPFLQRDRFMKDLKEKRIDMILVDAVCALAARFSPHPLLSPPQARPIDGDDDQPDAKKSNNGQPFAHRAMREVVDALSCPTLSVVQACLLLAYEEFGSNHDSGLWMYLGIAIRMAQDLGMQKLQGLKHNYGRTGLRPKAVITGQAGKLSVEQSESPQTSKSGASLEATDEAERAVERERVDTFWSIFFLDRVISSGTGRPVTLRDEDIELRFPLQSESILSNGWPAPFPPLIRIIHLYGRVTDLINAIQEDNHIDAETLKRLAGMESDLTGIYQRLSPKLHFNTMNFQAYVKAQEGTNFILLHFWFHTLIVLLHQPTLLNSFGGRIQQLYPNSRELSMSSAKTIADILSFSELIDAKSFIGNPFTSQPMYIAACAFLMESAYYSSPSSRAGSPGILVTDQTSAFTIPHMDTTNGTERKANAKHSLLASAAKENYQRCYRALQSLQTYWEGTKYILTVLDQKAKGIGDPLLYTTEEMESTAEIPITQSLASPNWQQPPSRRLSLDLNARKVESAGPAQSSAVGDPSSPRIDPSQAIGWALTGEINSSQPNISLLYQLPAPPLDEAQVADQGIPSAQIQRSGPSYPPTISAYSSSQAAAAASISASVPKFPASNDNMLSSNPYTPSGTGTPTGTHNVYNQNLVSSQLTSYGYATAGSSSSQPLTDNLNILAPQMTPQMSDMLIESQDIDMNSFHNQNSFPFAFSNDFNPWLEYLPPDVINNYFGDPSQNYGTTLMSPPDVDDQRGSQQ
ncbi:putative C6 transcription factor [Talaromyces proteolyticus]|uniref:C6 transcription factor n=1 Tax=Talaromyces proteolyticus TaxID=1131652 RepID=A0AAD4PZE8_9EURO|nr:putative C6 transcription factor [Talaromyces proteolyticus]KAH8698951.1 putative C6 transcription factor [Talaromyces proteolyticus]